MVAGVLASHHADRFWGLLAAVLAGAYIVWALRTSSRMRRADLAEDHIGMS